MRYAKLFHLLCLTAGEYRSFSGWPIGSYPADTTQGQLEFLYKIVGRGTFTGAMLTDSRGKRLLAI